jgi:hypothetical protein
MTVTSHLPASHVTVPQTAHGRPDQAAAAVHAVLRVAAAEDPSRHFASLQETDVKKERATTSTRADSYGLASFGGVLAQPQLLPQQAGSITWPCHLTLCNFVIK